MAKFAVRIKCAEIAKLMLHQKFDPTVGAVNMRRSKFCVKIPNMEIVFLIYASSVENLSSAHSKFCIHSTMIDAVVSGLDSTGYRGWWSQGTDIASGKVAMASSSIEGSSRFLGVESYIRGYHVYQRLKKFSGLV